ncbi:MAG TPA: glycosyltransferase family 2 protein [Pseudomonadales bacterium]|nr:glycosyltransferase family 2 protein [Pseudomonadales bacterium]
MFGFIVWLASLVTAAVLLLFTLPGTLELVWLTAGAWRRYQPVPAATRPIKFAIVIPAHNESVNIVSTLTHLKQCFPNKGGCDIFVIADNCADDTADKAHASGVNVFVRNDLQNRGKGFALDYAFRRLLENDYDAFIVIDADIRVEPNLLVEFEKYFSHGADGVQCRYRLSNAQVSTRVRLMDIAFTAFNLVRTLGRENWGCSVGILGTGFGVSRQSLLTVPYDARSVVEDLEHHINMVRVGQRVRFVNNTTIWSDAPTDDGASAGQRARWEGGRFRMMREMIPKLATQVLAGQWRLLEPLFELLLLPLAFHVVLLVACLLHPWLTSYALLALAVVVWHVLTAVRFTGRGWSDVLALCAAPFYIFWKLSLAKVLMRGAKKNAEWVRTKRE